MIIIFIPRIIELRAVLWAYNTIRFGYVQQGVEGKEGGGGGLGAGLTIPRCEGSTALLLSSVARHERGSLSFSQTLQW